MSSAIPIHGQKSAPLQFARDSFAHSAGMGGISWGGASVGSWLRDEVLMATREPPRDAPRELDLAHDLAPHGLGQTPQDLGPASLGPGAQDLGTLGALGGETLADAELDLRAPRHVDESSYFPSMEATFCRDYSCCGTNLPTLHDLLRHYEEQHISPSPPEEAPVMRRTQNVETVSTNDVFLPFDAGPSNGLAFDQGLDDLAMALDEPPAFAPPSFQPLSNAGLAQGINKPAAMNNVVNPPQSQFLGPALLDDEEPTIDDPARQLYMLERVENKPFRCPVIGCEKTYKNQNGLKYHRQHGHQNQTLHQNDDGTFSIIDPLSNTPYPDGMGMEKDKPYRCEICGKRYKNLNGLKYHRAHSTH